MTRRSPNGAPTGAAPSGAAPLLCENSGLPAASARPRSAWSPLAHEVFRWLWIASVASNVGTWMQNVGAAWLMTSLSASPLMVALVQTATNLPVFLLGIPAGAVADIADRRRLLIITQTWMLAAAAVLGWLCLAGGIGPWGILWLTFALGLGATMNAPAWQAIVPELVPRDELPAAIAMNSVGFNVARAAGPALGGLVVAATNPGVAFLLNAVSFVGVVVVLYYWRRSPDLVPASGEGVASAILAGIRYTRHSPPLITVLVRSTAFVFSASCLWSILPLVAKIELHRESTGYGILLGCLGAGSVGGAFLLGRIRHLFNVNLLVAAGVCLFSLATLALAWIHQFLVVALFLLAGGAAWMTVMSSFNTAAQTALPEWVRARGMSVYIFVFQGSMALGSVLWGAVAERFGLRVSLAASGFALLAGLAATLRKPLHASDEIDTRPSSHWPEPNVVVQPRPGDGPVLVMVEYFVDQPFHLDFRAAMRGVEQIRRRDGGVQWGLFEDASSPGRFLESFLVDSWAEHLRQHSRATMADLAVMERAQSFHRGPAPPAVSHWISTYR